MARTAFRASGTRAARARARRLRNEERASYNGIARGHTLRLVAIGCWKISWRQYNAATALPVAAELMGTAYMIRVSYSILLRPRPENLVLHGHIRDLNAVAVQDVFAEP